MQSCAWQRMRCMTDRTCCGLAATSYLIVGAALVAVLAVLEVFVTLVIMREVNLQAHSAQALLPLKRTDSCCRGVLQGC